MRDKRRTKTKVDSLDLIDVPGSIHCIENLSEKITVTMNVSTFDAEQRHAVAYIHNDKHTNDG
jgi:hypothetical protein